MLNYYIGCKNAASASAKIELYNCFNEHIYRYFYGDAKHAINDYQNTAKPNHHRFYLKDIDTHKWVELAVIC